MKKLIAVLMMVFVTSIAHAVNYGTPGNNPGNPQNPGIGGPPVSNPGNGGQQGGDVTVTNDLDQKVTVVTLSESRSASLSASKSLSASNSSSKATGGNATATGGSAVTTSTSSSGGNSQSINIGGDSGNRRYSGSYTARTTGVAPDIVANPTAPCRVAVGVSGGWIGGALGLSGSVLDEGCDARADATMLVMMGYEGAAASRLCQKPEMAKALGSVICPKPDTAVATSNGSAGGFNH